MRSGWPASMNPAMENATPRIGTSEARVKYVMARGELGPSRSPKRSNIRSRCAIHGFSESRFHSFTGAIGLVLLADLLSVLNVASASVGLSIG